MREWEKLNFASEAEEKAAFEEFLDEKRKHTNIFVDMGIDEFNLTVRTYKSLVGAGLTTVGAVYWQVIRLGDRWGNKIRNLGKISQKEAEDVLLGDQISLINTGCHKTRICYLISLLETRGHILSRSIRIEIADYLRALPRD